MERFIQAQARVAFSKSNRAAGLEVEDFVSIGYVVYWKALQTWDSTKNTKFNTYLTLCLQRMFYKVNSKTMRKKRGGAGNKAEDERFGRGNRWDGKSPECAKIHSLQISSDEESSDQDSIQLEAITSTESEYDLLVQQVGKLMSASDLRVYKQMVDPDEQLVEIAAKAVEGQPNRKCTISDTMMAEYLKLSRQELVDAKHRVRECVGKHLNYKSGK
jgi:hypothetical protein